MQRLLIQNMVLLQVSSSLGFNLYLSIFVFLGSQSQSYSFYAEDDEEIVLSQDSCLLPSHPQVTRFAFFLEMDLNDYRCWSLP